MSNEQISNLRRKAEQGDPEAQFNLAGLYYHGDGVPQDYVTARQWSEKAAAQGYAMAQYNLGLLYVNGQGVARDYVRAYMWYNLAALRSTSDVQKGVAAENRDEIAARMTPAQIAEAQKLARKWKPKMP